MTGAVTLAMTAAVRASTHRWPISHKAGGSDETLSQALASQGRTQEPAQLTALFKHPMTQTRAMRKAALCNLPQENKTPLRVRAMRVRSNAALSETRVMMRRPLPDCFMCRQPSSNRSLWAVAPPSHVPRGGKTDCKTDTQPGRLQLEGTIAEHQRGAHSLQKDS